MRTALILLLLCQPPFVCSQQKPIPKSKATQQQPQADRRGTQDSPLVVKMLDPEDAQERAAQIAQDRQEKAATDLAIIRLNKGLVFVGVAQGVLFLVQLWMMWRAQATTKLQLRAYLTVRTGNIYVESRQPDLWWLEWGPQIVNVGQTPAYDVDAMGRLEILPVPLPPDIDLAKRLRDKPLPDYPSRTSLGTGQDLRGAYHLNRSVSESEFQNLKAWTPQKALYVFGTVKYSDVFGRQHRTNFCQIAIWPPGDGDPRGSNIERHNDAD